MSGDKCPDYSSGARLAQSVERKALNLVVVGSSPTVGDAQWSALLRPGSVYSSSSVLWRAHSAACRAIRILTRAGAPGIAPLVLPP